MIRLESARFHACNLSTDHMRDVQQLYADPRVAAQLFGATIQPPENAAEIVVRRFIAHWDAHGFGPFVFLDRDAQEFVGYAGLRHTIADGKVGVELLYAIRPDYWGQGVCTEIAQCALQNDIRQLGLREVLSFTLPDNLASQRVLQKLNFQEAEDCIYGGVPHKSYQLLV